MSELESKNPAFNCWCQLGGALKNLDQSFSMGSQWDKIGKYGQKQVDLVVFSGRNLQSPGYWLLNYNNTHEALLI